MSCRTLVGYGLLVALLIALPGCKKDKKDGGGKDGGKEGGTVKYDSPKEVFAAAKKAEEDKDIKALFNCFSKDSQDTFAAGMAFGAAFASGAEGEKGKPLKKILEKHGLTEKRFKEIQKERPKTPKDQAKAMKKLIEPVQDKAAFVAEVKEAMDKLSDMKDKDKMLEGAELKDVKITGDKAKGTIVGKKDGKEKKEPIEFVKEGGGWKVVIPQKELGGE